MLACVFGRTGKAATSNLRGSDDDDDNGNDADNIRWELIDPQGRKGGKRAYRAARARLLREGATRIFQVGDCITAKGDKDVVWVGHIIGFFEVLTEAGISGTDASSLRVILRWFYGPKDLESNELDAAVNNNIIRRPNFDELFFSDYVDTSGNPLECIIGKAFIRATKKGLDATKANPPRDYWKDSDNFFLCRCFYASSDDQPPRPIRPLENGELAYLLQNPTIEDLYSKSLLFKRHGHSIKKDLEGNTIWGKHKPVAVKTENRIVSPNDNKKKKKKKKNVVKKDHTELRPMYICPCCPEWDGKALVNYEPNKKRRASTAPDAQEAPKRARADIDNNTGSPSQVVGDAKVEPMINVANGANSEMVSDDDNNNIKDEDDLEELPYTPPRLAENENSNNNNEGAPGYAYAAEMEEIEQLGEIRDPLDMETPNGAGDCNSNSNNSAGIAIDNLTQEQADNIKSTIERYGLGNLKNVMNSNSNNSN